VTSQNSSKLVPGRSYGDKDFCLLRHISEQKPAAVQGGDSKQSKVSFFDLLFVYLLVVYVYDVFVSYFTLNS